PPGGHYGGPPPMGPHGGPYGGPPPQKKTSPWLWIGLGCGGLFVIGVVLVVLLVFVFGGNDSGDNGGTATGGSESGEESGPSGSSDSGLGRETRSNPEMPGLGETVEHDGLNFTVVEVETGVGQVGRYAPDGEHVVVWVEVSPAGSDQGTFWRDEQHLYTYDGEAIQEDYEATGEHSEDSMYIDVGAGESRVTSIVFDVEDPAEISYMGLSSRTLGGNEIEVDVTG
ncbi:DUF4352 domain-containing protein, partial [Nocardiopsis sp. MG754419]|uniref:DUF4352 domain-containing protein n=1 Tax=Nocardiopsis sp. MG754419 TaxID=2259865 RepID=UPI001BA76701